MGDLANVNTVKCDLIPAISGPLQVLEIEKRDAGDMSGTARHKTRQVLQCELAATELADALGLKPDSLFVDSMFTLADKDGNGYLSFQEFLDVIVIFMKGKANHMRGYTWS